MERECLPLPPPLPTKLTTPKEQATIHTLQIRPRLPHDRRRPLERKLPYVALFPFYFPSSSPPVSPPTNPYIQERKQNKPPPTNNTNPASPPKPQSQTAEPPSPAYQTECTTWVNLSAFLARCEAANFYANCDDRLRYPSIDVELALEKPLSPGILGETRLLVAANWIFHCAGLIHESQVTHDAKGTDSWNTKKWVIWEERLKTELEKARGDGNNNLKLVRALERALRVMSEVVAGSK